MGSNAWAAVDLSRAQRILGYDADVCTFNPDPYGYESDKIVRPTEQKANVKTVLSVLYLLGQLDYDLYHRHGNFVKWGLEGEILRLFRKKQIIHYHGSEVRGRRVRSRRKCFVSTPDLLRYVDNSIWIPTAVRPDPFLSIPFCPGNELVVGYYRPSYGRYVPMEGLTELGRMIKLKPLEKTPHSRVAEYYSQIDVWVDRFGLDSYGLCAVEAAMSGKPVIAQIGDRELAQMDNCPFINIRKEVEIRRHLEVLASNVNLRRELGELARNYAVRVHDWLRVAKLLTTEYEGLL